MPKLAGRPDRRSDRHRLPGRCRLLDAVRHHRHDDQRPVERPDGGGGPAQPGRGGPGRDARRRRVRLPRRRAVAARRLGIFTMYHALLGDVSIDQAPFLIVGFGFGASFVALFAQLGGGIYTKAADVGSDLVGKVEAGIPEDDPRNAAVIADLVGDNVGDCAGRGADLFESTAAENIGAMILGVAVYTIATAAGWPNPSAWIFFPLVVRAFGLLATIVAMFFIRGREDRGPDEHPQPRLLGDDDPVGPRHGLRDQRDDAGRRRRPRNGFPVWVWFFGAGVVGLATSVGVRLHHPVLHGGLVPPGPRDRRGIQDRPRDEHHQRHRGRLRDHLRHRDHDRPGAPRQPLAGLAGTPRPTPTARTSAASSEPPSRPWACS